MYSDNSNISSQYSLNNNESSLPPNDPNISIDDNIIPITANDPDHINYYLQRQLSLLSKIFLMLLIFITIAFFNYSAILGLMILLSYIPAILFIYGHIMLVI